LTPSSREANPVEDHNNWYKVGVEPHRVDELREYVRETGRAFGQKYLYFERAGEAEFVRTSIDDPLTGTVDNIQP
jgi:uncharacterized membrane protein